MWVGDCKAVCCLLGLCFGVRVAGSLGVGCLKSRSGSREELGSWNKCRN